MRGRGVEERTIMKTIEQLKAEHDAARAALAAAKEAEKLAYFAWAKADFAAKQARVAARKAGAEDTAGFNEFAANVRKSVEG